MVSEDLVLIGALGVVVASLAYLLGRRRAEAPLTPTSAGPASPPPSSPAPASAGRSAAKPATPPAEPAPVSLPKLNDEPSSRSGVDRLYAEEDDEEVEPTRVGSNAAGAGHTIYQPPIKRITEDDDADSDEPTLTESFFLVHAAAQTDKGLRRKRNEDSVLVLDSENLFVIADGMGGYQGGQLASQTAVKTIAAAYKSQTFEGPPHEGVPADATNLARAIQMANAAILELARRKPEFQGMGTTICAARFSPNKKRLFIGHVGDSRCYRLRNGVFKQMTADHTMADFGVTGPESAQLSRAVGVWPTVPIDIVTIAPAVGDVYLVCSDGLTKMLTDETIGAVLRGEEDPKATVERLIFFANSRGGKDNITVILVRVVPITSGAPPA